MREEKRRIQKNNRIREGMERKEEKYKKKREEEKRRTVK